MLVISSMLNMTGEKMTQDILLICSAIALIVAVVALIFIVIKILSSPFCYPYFTYKFDVSGKRNVDLADLLDQFLCLDRNWTDVVQHQNFIEQWKRDSEGYIDRCMLKKRRARQYLASVDDANAFQFITVRGQTRYRQKNYVKHAYKVSVPDKMLSVSWEWLNERHRQLALINFETTLKKYHSNKQRRLMTKSLRKSIMERDNYTCQLCGKYMPDEVGLHIDHIVPVAKGGKTVPSNLRVLCSKCNGKKGARVSGTHE